MCSRVVSRLSLKRDFTQEPSLIFSFSLSPCMIIVFSLPAAGFACTEYKTPCLCVTHKCAGVHFLTQTYQHIQAFGSTFSMGTSLNIFNLMCVLTTTQRVHGLCETFVLRFLAHSDWNIKIWLYCQWICSEVALSVDHRKKRELTAKQDTAWSFLR